MNAAPVAALRAVFAGQRALGERAMGQLAFDELTRVPFPGGNSVATIVRHLSGNMKSRWTDFLTTDGEKPWRERDREFEDAFPDRNALMTAWNAGWHALESALATLTDADLPRMVTIRGEPHTVHEAALRQVSHYGYHVGQIVLLARWTRGAQWTPLSIPRGGSAAFNAAMDERRQGS
jgi:hypothetical protein